jgi:hypothetical protein
MKHGLALVLVLLVSSSVLGQAKGLFASHAVVLGFGASALSSDGKVRVSVAEIDSDTDDGFPAILRVQIGTHVLERRFNFGLNAGWPEPPNIGAVAWLSDTRLLVAAEIMPHSNCDSMGTFVAYEFALPTGRLERRYDQLEAKKRWRAQLGVELLEAPDECIRKPRACFVPFNHPDRQAPE